jgi:hypothetical protein
MPNISFSLFDYQNNFGIPQYSPPDALYPYYDINPDSLRLLKESTKGRGPLAAAIQELRRRLGDWYFNRTYTLQGRLLGYSVRAFPAYDVLLPEVMTEDWLSIVDWGKFARDHVLHQPLCGYVTLKLLDGDNNAGALVMPNGQTILQTCVDKVLQWDGTAYIRDFLLRSGMRPEDPLLERSNSVAQQIWATIIRETAYIAAVFHDMGYPWQYKQKLTNNLSLINTQGLREGYNVQEIKNLFGQRLLFRALNGYQIPSDASPSIWAERLSDLLDKSLAGTHGLPGALGFLHLHDSVRRFPAPGDQSLKLLCIEWAATAIMMHDMVKIYWGEGIRPPGAPEYRFLRLNFDRDPISALITLVDVIQDFERPYVSFLPLPRTVTGDVALQYDKACSQTELEFDGSGRLEIRYQMIDDAQRAIKRSSIANENRLFFDNQNGYLDLSALGFTGVRMSAV